MTEHEGFLSAEGYTKEKAEALLARVRRVQPFRSIDVIPDAIRINCVEDPEDKKVVVVVMMQVEGVEGYAVWFPAGDVLEYTSAMWNSLAMCSLDTLANAVVGHLGESDPAELN